MNDSKSKRTTFLAMILVGLLILAYKMMFVSDTVDVTAEDNTAASVRVQAILEQVEGINFDTSVMQDPKFRSLKSIETPLISLPVGKEDPFSKNSGSN